MPSNPETLTLRYRFGGYLLNGDQKMNESLKA